MPALITFQEVTKQYEGHIALDKISFALPQGSIFGLLGPNGAGKTTLLRILTRILLPDSGKVMYGEENLQAKHVKKLGYLPEERGLYPKMRADEHLSFLAALKGLTTAQIQKSISFWSRTLEMDGLLNRKIETLSKGQQQKIQMMAALIHDPDFIILDEPFSGFDPVNAELLKKVLQDLQSEGKTLLISTHRMENAEELCQDILMLHQGRVVLKGPLEEILTQQTSLLYEVTTTSPLVPTTDFDIIKVDKGKTVIQTKNRIDRNLFLQSLMQQTEVISFLPQRKMLKEVFLENARQAE